MGSRHFEKLKRINFLINLVWFSDESLLFPEKCGRVLVRKRKEEDWSESKF